jgi:nucleoid-associated protein YgaU
MRHLLILAVAAVLLLTGCSEEQIRQAEALSTAANARYAQSQEILRLAQEAVAQAEVIATSTGSAQAQQVVAQAHQALTVAQSASEAAKVAVDAGDAAVASAKTAQAAGGGVIGVLGAVVGTLIPAAIPLLIALQKLADTRRSLGQTISGVEQAKATLPDDAVKKLHSALSAAQDVKTKRTVKLVKAAA